MGALIATVWVAVGLYVGQPGVQFDHSPPFKTEAACNEFRSAFELHLRSEHAVTGYALKCIQLDVNESDHVAPEKKDSDAQQDSYGNDQQHPIAPPSSGLH